MTRTPTEAELLAALAREQGVSEDAVRTVLDALRRGGGTMAQFSHADFGGMSQWSSGMTMVGDMFNDSLRAKLDAIAVNCRGTSASIRPSCSRMTCVSYRSAALVMPAHGGPKSLATRLPSDLRMTCATRYFP